MVSLSVILWVMVSHSYGSSLRGVRRNYRSLVMEQNLPAASAPPPLPNDIDPVSDTGSKYLRSDYATPLETPVPTHPPTHPPTPVPTPPLTPDKTYETPIYDPPFETQELIPPSPLPSLVPKVSTRKHLGLPTPFITPPERVISSLPTTPPSMSSIHRSLKIPSTHTFDTIPMLPTPPPKSTPLPKSQKVSKNNITNILRNYYPIGSYRYPFLMFPQFPMMIQVTYKNVSVVET